MQMVMAYYIMAETMTERSCHHSLEDEDEYKWTNDDRMKCLMSEQNEECRLSNRQTGSVQ